MAPKLYYFPMSPTCRAVLMVAKAIGLELELEEVEREFLRTEEMLEINPQHTVPLLIDPVENFSIWDSHAIAIYLVGQYATEDSLYPKSDVKKCALITQRLHFDNLLFEKCKDAFHPVLAGVADEVTDESKESILEYLGILDIFLKDKPWIAGEDLTIADLTLLAIITTIEEVAFAIDPERFPRLTKWLTNGKNLVYFEECNKEGLNKFKEMSRHEVPLI
ncbi:glutathione S-transferase D4-like [Euwallacea fornicatus]|uniref:glutathione S-transferase D4-like n=1 Tax=Euwallacea fornicatus TaxID=995702 RepID=UPI00338ECCBA